MTRRRGSSEENIWWCRKVGIKQSSMEDGGASHLGDGPLIFHETISTPIEGENHRCETESCTYASFFSCLLVFLSWNPQPFFDKQQLCVPCDIVSNYGWMKTEDPEIKSKSLLSWRQQARDNARNTLLMQTWLNGFSLDIDHVQIFGQRMLAVGNNGILKCMNCVLVNVHRMFESVMYQYFKRPSTFWFITLYSLGSHCKWTIKWSPKGIKLRCSVLFIFLR